MSAVPNISRPREKSFRSFTIAVAGNPNAGKTSLFNALTGLRQKVANYPGVTVESKVGRWSLTADDLATNLIDLPGLYSLEATSLVEQIARDVLLGQTGMHPPRPNRAASFCAIRIASPSWTLITGSRFSRFRIE